MDQKPINANDSRELLKEEWTEMESLANIGELAGPVFHEFNNFLNNISLHLALPGQEGKQPNLGEIRDQVTHITAVMKQFQQYRRSHSTFRPVDLNLLVQESFHKPRVRLELDSKIPPVMGVSSDLKRLCTFLVTQAFQVTPAPGEIEIKTDFSRDKVLLQIADSGPVISAELLHHFFEPGMLFRPGSNSLELAACKSLARRLQGKIRAENRLPRGVLITVELLPAMPELKIRE
jgi:signal transduction histidine kinase